MGQVNVNTPGDPGPREGGYGAGMIVGVLVAIVVIILLVYFLVLNPGGGGTNGGTDGGGTEDDGGDAVPEPTGWRLVELA